MIDNIKQEEHLELKTYLIGFRLDPENEEPDFFTALIQDKETDFHPLLCGSQIVLFANLKLLSHAFDLAGLDVALVGLEPGEALWVDFAEAFYLLQSGLTDSSRSLIFLLNTLSDIFIGLRVTIPPEYKNALTIFADHMTFNNDFGEFFTHEGITRQTVIEAFQWSLGTIFSCARLLK